MGLESAASRSLVSSSSSKHSTSSSLTIFGFFERCVAALGLDFKVRPSDERAVATSFKSVVRDFSDLGAALEPRLEREALWDLFPMGCEDLGINRQQVPFLGVLLTRLWLFAAWPGKLMAVSVNHRGIRRCKINHERWYAPYQLL